MNQVIRLSIGNVALKQVQSFVYLGGKVTSSNSSSKDIARLATGVARSLQPIWKSANIAAGTKLVLCKSLILSVLLYNAETWCLKEADKCMLRVFEMSVLRRITGNTLRDRRHNESIREGL